MDSYLVDAHSAYFGNADFIVNQSIADLTTNQYNAMLLGIVHGVIQQEGLTEIGTCITDVEGEAHQAFTAFEDLWHREWKTGFQEIVATVKGLPTAMTDCTTISDDVATLESWATVFLAPADLENVIRTNITHNLLKLTRDLNKAKNEWKNEEYYQFGTTLGDMVVIATQPLAAEMAFE